MTKSEDRTPRFVVLQPRAGESALRHFGLGISARTADPDRTDHRQVQVFGLHGIPALRDRHGRYDAERDVEQDVKQDVERDVERDAARPFLPADRRPADLFTRRCSIAPGFHYLCRMKNIVFDLGGVVFARDVQKCTPDFIRFFDFVRAPEMPGFWEEYDRGTRSLDETKEAMCSIRGCTREKCDAYVQQAIALQEPVKPTERLLGDLKYAGYKLYVLSNMSKEFIAFLRRFPLYGHFDGEVISCEEQTVKPEPRIYRILLDRYGLAPEETLFIDDRPANLEAAARFGIRTRLFRHGEPEASCDELRKMLL